MFRVPTVREKSVKNEKKFKVREKSGNFGKSQAKVREFITTYHILNADNYCSIK